ncbi:MAG TPA: hypothetical protein VFZ47_00305 [Chitinophagaceae bacterium]
MILLDISTWWQSMGSFEKILWAIALIFSILFIIQSVLSAAGGDTGEASGHADDYVADDHGIGYQFFTIKNMVAFFTMFGWVGVAAYKGGMSEWITIIVALVGGLLMVAIMAVLFRNVSRLKHSGTMEIKNAMDQVGETYLFIPAKRGGIGKVHVKVQGTLRELQALTDDATDIPTGKIIKVTGILNNSILLVTAIS